ncbi:MAG: hypothetical protein V7K41_00370 [Nostoc sp.]
MRSLTAAGRHRSQHDPLSVFNCDAYGGKLRTSSQKMGKRSH